MIILDKLPPSELIALKEYYDKKWKNSSGCRNQKQIDAQSISAKIEQRLLKIVADI